MQPHTPAVFSMLNHEKKHYQMNQEDFSSPVGLVSNLIIFDSLMSSAVMGCGSPELSCYCWQLQSHTQTVSHVCCQTQTYLRKEKQALSLCSLKDIFLWGAFWKVGKNGIKNKSIPFFSPLAKHLQTGALQHHRATVSQWFRVPLKGRAI